MELSEPQTIEVVSAQDVMKEMYDALQVLRLDPKHREHLKDSDPQALRQASNAVERYKLLRAN